MKNRKFLQNFQNFERFRNFFTQILFPDAISEGFFFQKTVGLVSFRLRRLSLKNRTMRKCRPRGASPSLGLGLGGAPHNEKANQRPLECA